MMDNSYNGHNFSQEDDSMFTLAELWGMVWGHKVWYVVSVLFFIAAGAFYLYRTPQVYDRYVKVIIDESSQAATMRNLGVATAGAMKLGTSNNVENEMEAFASPDLMKIVVERLGLQTRYFEKQFLRKVELYKNGPVEMRLAGGNPRSSFSFDVRNNGDGTLTLSSFRIKKDKIKAEVTGTLGDTLQTPAGAVVIYPVESENEFKYPIRVQWSNSMSTAKYYDRILGVSLSGKESSVVVLSMEDTYPSRSEMILGSLVDVYNEIWISGKNKSLINTAEFIDERLGRIENELAAVENLLKEYKSDNGLTDIKITAKSFVDEASLYAEKSFEISNQLSVAGFIRSYLNDPKNYASLIPSNLGLTGTAVENQIKEYNEGVLLRDRLLADSSENNPLIADLNAGIVSMRSAILRSVENLISSLELQLAKIDSQEKKILGRMSSNSDQEIHLMALERQQQVTQNLYVFLLQKREENELAALVNVGNTRVIMSPNGPQKPIAPSKKMVALAMLMLGFGCPFMVFFLLKYFDRSVRNRGDLSSLSVPFLAEIPRYVTDEDRRRRFKRRNDNDKSVCKVIVEAGKRDMMNEAFRVLRTNVDLMLGKNTGAKVVMMTSFNPNAGKTFTIMNLASSMALKKSKVLLVDLDMRKASLSKTLDIVHTGVAAYLNGKVDDYTPYTEEIAPDLYVLPVGTLPPNPTELLSSERFVSMIDRMRQEYDYIFLDCPPIDIVADSNIITDVVDMTVFVMRANRMDKDVLPLVEQLYVDGRYRHMALILNGVDIQYKKYGYGKSSYGYGYGNIS